MYMNVIVCVCVCVCVCCTSGCEGDTKAQDKRHLGSEGADSEGEHREEGRRYHCGDFHQTETGESSMKQH